MAQDYEFSKTPTLDELMGSSNVCELLDEDDCKYIGRCAMQGYQEDLSSRSEWEIRNARANKLALQVMEDKTFPWQGCSNVKFPLVTVAAMQYAARAYPALIDCTDLVNCVVYGEDPDGQKTERGNRIAAHMTWQNIRQDKGWEDAHDKAFLVQAIAGAAFIKKTFDPAKRHQVTKLVLPMNFVINYWTRDLESSTRYTEVFELTDNDIRQRELDGRFCKPYQDESDADQDDAKLPKQQPPGTTDPLKVAQDMRQGMTEPPVGYSTPYQTGEQYCWWDLDDDGYAEPYIVTFDIGTGFVRRIVARFLPGGVKMLKDAVYEIEPVKVYYVIPFIPSPDGGFYPLGLGHLLGPINESINTNINQLNDAGTMANSSGGFMGRGFKNRGGPMTIRPFEWYPIDAPGDDLHKNILPLPVREPSAVLLQLAQFLIAYGERIASANDIQMGESPGQNTPAETTRTLNENGMRVYSAIYKRTWRAIGEGFCIQYDLNKLFLPHSEDFVQLTSGKGAMIRADDYKGPALEVVPSADPYVVSDTQKVQQAEKLLQAASQLPGFNRYQAGLRWLKAMKVPNVDAIYPQPMTQGPDGKPMPSPDFPPPPPDPKMITAQANAQKVQLQGQKQQADMTQAYAQLQMEIQESRAKVQNLLAQAQLYEAQAKTEVSEPIIKLIYAEIESEGSRSERMLRTADLLLTHVRETKANEADGASDGKAIDTGGSGLETAGTNAAFLANPQGNGSGLAGRMGTGALPIQ
jgi:chaperonin GroES